MFFLHLNLSFLLGINFIESKMMKVRISRGWSDRSFSMPVKFISSSISRWWFQICFTFTPTWGRFPI